MLGAVVRRFRPLADDSSSEEEADVVSHTTLQGSSHTAHHNVHTKFTSLNISSVSSSSSSEIGDEPAASEAKEESHDMVTTKEDSVSLQRDAKAEKVVDVSLHDTHSTLHLAVDSTHEASPVVNTPTQGSVHEVRTTSRAQDSIGSSGVIRHPSCSSPTTVLTTQSSSHTVGPSESHTTISRSLSKPFVAVAQFMENGDTHEALIHEASSSSSSHAQVTQVIDGSDNVKSSSGSNIYCALNRIACLPAQQKQYTSVVPSVPFASEGDRHVLLPAVACEVANEEEEQEKVTSGKVKLQLPSCLCASLPSAVHITQPEDTTPHTVDNILDDTVTLPHLLPPLTKQQVDEMTNKLRRDLQEQVETWQAAMRASVCQVSPLPCDEHEARRVVSAWLLRDVGKAARGMDSVAAMRKAMRTHQREEEDAVVVDLLRYTTTPSPQVQGVL